MERIYFVYIMTNTFNTVLYTGFTGDLSRIEAHKTRSVRGFTSRYHLTKLVYIESIDDYNAALHREKQIKGWLRRKKIKLIESQNPRWEDVSIYDLV